MTDSSQNPLTKDKQTLIQNTKSVVSELLKLQNLSREFVKNRVSIDGKISAERVESDQHVVHGFAWLATYIKALEQISQNCENLFNSNNLSETDILLSSIVFGEYLAQILSGIPMSQGEFIRPTELGLDYESISKLRESPAVLTLLEHGNCAENRLKLTQIMQNHPSQIYGNNGLDETENHFRAEMQRFADTEVKPYAQQWHRNNEYIPMSLIESLAEMGVFGLTIPEKYGGSELGKVSMCVVSEELSRGYIGVGSLGTRSEIAGELILCGGTAEQKQQWLPKIASGEILPTAVFTEPNNGSDLAALRCRAELKGEEYSVTGNKTWITHPVRADIMTLLVRTNQEEKGYKGISMLLAEKPRGTDQEPFPAAGMSGSEIEPLGYRGMKEYEIAFDGFKVKQENLLGGEEGQGFKQLMQTFESARIQTAARAVGVAQSALDLGLQYSLERVQFGKNLIQFPRVSNKLALMATEIMAVRQLTYFAAKEKDSGRRCDVEAGMAKLLGGRVAWAAADNAVQIHGGNGYALEYEISRVLCDARILNIFEGAAEIQAQVISRRLLEDHN